MALAQSRGDADRIWRRAVTICQEMNIAPWVALAVAEGLIPLKQAVVFDRAARCKDLQAAVLDARKSIDELRAHRPYAPYLLAADLVEALASEGLTMPPAMEIAEALLSVEAPIAPDGCVLPLRQRPLSEYVRVARRIGELVRKTGCPLSMAIDVGTGRADETFVARYVEQKRRLQSDAEQRRNRFNDARRTPRRFPAVDRYRPDRKPAPRPGDVPGRV